MSLAVPAGIRSALERAGTGSPLPVLAPTIRVARFVAAAIVVYLAGLCMGFLWTMRESLDLAHFVALVALPCGPLVFVSARGLLRRAARPRGRAMDGPSSRRAIRRRSR